MRNISYEFELTATTGSTTAHKKVSPLYGSDLSIDIAKESNEEYFRRELSGKLTFVRDDFDFINKQDFECEFEIRILISDTRYGSFRQYWTGTFWKTDCEFNLDDKSVSVKPEVSDEYNAVLGGIEKEYDLLGLAPEIQPIMVTKRPMVQVYVPGQSAIGCFLSGMYWETECESVESVSDLRGKYHFAKAATGLTAKTSGSFTPALPDAFIGGVDTSVTTGDPFAFAIRSGLYAYTFSYETKSEQDPGTSEMKDYTYTYWKILRLSDAVEMWSKTDKREGTQHVSALQTVTLAPVSESGASGEVTIDSTTVDVYSRFVTDCEKVGGVDTYEIADDDIVENNRNYHRVVGYDFKDTIYFSGNLTSEATRWGIYQPGQYYQQPYALGIPAFYPVAKSAWGRMSVWFAFSSLDETVEASGRKEYELRNAYPLASAISVLLKAIGAGVTHEATEEYSQFLYKASNPLDGSAYTLFIAPKSNILAGDYDQPAQKAPLTLRQITDMLRDCFRCYWFIEDGKFKIEHIEYFRNGGTYSGTANVGIDLTQQKVTRTGKSWAFGTSTYSYDKPEMPERYQFGWMDDVTQPFEGDAIEMVSKYVEEGNIEEITVSEFTSDVDYMLLNPSGCSSDGFALLAAMAVEGGYKLPLTKLTLEGVEYTLQNGYMSFSYLQKYYLYDMPAKHIKMNNEERQAFGVKKQKTQTIKFPMLFEPQMTEMVKTELGDGVFEKISLNLSSRAANVTLRYDTE